MKFIEGLAKSLAYIDGFFTSYVLFHLVQLDVFELLAQGDSLPAIAKHKEVDEEVLRAVIEFLMVDGIVERHGAEYALSEYGRALSSYAGWFLEFIGGYGPTLAHLTDILRGGAGASVRNGRYVALGSGQIDYYDIIPLAKELIRESGREPGLILDLGCGIGTCLIELCREFPQLKAVGVEPNEESCKIAETLREAAGLNDRIKFTCCDAVHYESKSMPDFIMLAFVLHEMAYQRGLEGVVAFLDSLGRRFPKALVLVFEVHNDSDNLELLRTPIGTYYKCYFLVHRLTKQRLLPLAIWERVFSEAGFEILEQRAVNPETDPTRLEMGYVLKHKAALSR